MSCFICINRVMHGWGPHVNIISLSSLCFSLSPKYDCRVCFSDARDVHINLFLLSLFKLLVLFKFSYF